MSNMRPPNRTPFQQGNMSTPTGFNHHRSPQIKKHNSSPAWGSGAIVGPKSNGPRPGQFTSPPQYNLTSPPPRPHQQQFPPYHNFMTSPRHYGNSFGNCGNTFRTPQPVVRNPSPQKSWSCDKNFRPMSHKRLNMKVRTHVLLNISYKFVSRTLLLD